MKTVCSEEVLTKIQKIFSKIKKNTYFSSEQTDDFICSTAGRER
jgi:hypothetical protein